MRNSNRKVVIVIFCDNNLALIDETLQSVLTQSYQNIRVIIVDNDSDDGSYETLVHYLKYDHFSLYRFSRKYIITRLHRKLRSIVTMSDPDFVSILSIGDIINANYIERCVEILSNPQRPDIKFIISELDIIDTQGEIQRQAPLYFKDTVFTKDKIFLDVLKKNIRHKVFGFYDIHILPQHLPDGIIFTDYNDLFRKIQLIKHQDMYYMHEKMGYIRGKRSFDVVEDFLLKYYYLKQIIISNLNNEDRLSYVDELVNNDDILRSLALCALEEASLLGVEEGDIARKLLLLSEILYKDIVNDALYGTVSDLVLYPREV